jgi:hypothetical protein
MTVRVVETLRVKSAILGKQRRCDVESAKVRLEYLAVHPTQRKAGLGHKLVLSAIETAHGRPLLTEIESASDDPASLRRQRFYSRCGFQPIAGLRYQLPLPGSPPPMELWVYPSGGAVSRQDLARWLTAIYTEVYHCSPDDSRIVQMLADCP